MASDAAVGRMLAILHELFPTRDLSPATLDAWALVFADWDDAEFQTCAMAAAREPSRTFFPTPGEVAAHRASPVVDTDVLLARISKLGTHHPNAGWLYPRVDAVRTAFGNATADAYAAAGGPLCYADDARDGSSTTRDIARQRFAAELRASVKRDPGALFPAAPSRPQLASGSPLALVERAS